MTTIFINLLLDLLDKVNKLKKMIKEVSIDETSMELKEKTKRDVFFEEYLNEISSLNLFCQYAHDMTFRCYIDNAILFESDIISGSEAKEMNQEIVFLLKPIKSDLSSGCVIISVLHNISMTLEQLLLLEMVGKFSTSNFNILLPKLEFLTELIHQTINYSLLSDETPKIFIDNMYSYCKKTIKDVLNSELLTNDIKHLYYNCLQNELIIELRDGIFNIYEDVPITINDLKDAISNCNKGKSNNHNTNLG